MNNINIINKYYENDCNEEKRLGTSNANNLEFLTTLHFIQKLCPENTSILDACAGVGIYAFPLAKLGYKVTAGDLVKYHIEEMIKINCDIDYKIGNIFCGSILDLSRFEDNSFDVVLNLGSYYHLINKKDRENSIKESLRVLKPNGLYFLSYINKYANYIKFPDLFFNDYKKSKNYIELGYDTKNPIFYASTPEEIDSIFEKFNIEKKHHIATDGLKFINKEKINTLSDLHFKNWLNIHLESCEIPSLLGYSEHCLYIGKKKTYN